MVKLVRKPERRSAGINIPMFAAAVLFCLTLISLHLTGGLYAKYTSAATGSDSARVISFGELTLTESGTFQNDGTLMMIPGVDLTKSAVVDFEGSESAVYVFAQIALSDDWTTADRRTFSITSGTKPLLSWSVDDAWTYLETNGNTYIYYAAVSPNTEFEENILSDSGMITVSNAITKNEMASLADVSIDLQASVVQSIGFDSPSDAWASLSAKYTQGGNGT